MHAEPPTLLEALAFGSALLVVLLGIVWPWISDWANRKAYEGEPDFDDEDRGGL
jgi:hypothetical protein